MKTRQEVEDLKKNWEHDPCWDIEHTDGFEEYAEELMAFRKKCEDRWAGERYLRLSKKAEDIGVPGNINLAAYIEGLEDQIQRLGERIGRIEDKR